MSALLLPWTNRAQSEVLLQKYSRLSQCDKDWPLVYSNQVPNLSLFLCRGSALVQSSKAQEKISAPVIVCLRELLLNAPVTNDIVIQAGSQFYMVHKQIAPMLQHSLDKI